MVRVGLAVGGATLLLIGGAALTWGSYGRADTMTTPLREINSVEIIRGSGSVEVRHQPGARAEVQERQHRSWWGGWWEGGDVRHQVDKGQLVLDTDCGWNCSVDYVVTLPTQVPIRGQLDSGSFDIAGMASVDAELQSGGIRVRDVAGPVQARTGSGEIELSDVSGQVDVETSSGEVSGRDLGGQDIVARTGSGNVTLGLLAPRSVDAETGSGEIELTVPQGPYRVDTSTGSGSEEVDVVRDPNAERRLKLSTGSGNIAVKGS